MTDLSQLEFTCKIGGQIQKLAIGSNISIDQDDLQSAFVNQAGYYVHYAALYRRAVQECQKLQDDFDIWFATEKSSVRATAEGKTTEKFLEEEVMAGAEYRSRREAINNMEFVRDTLKEYVEGFRHRREMLIQLGYRSREEGNERRQSDEHRIVQPHVREGGATATKRKIPKIDD